MPVLSIILFAVLILFTLFLLYMIYVLLYTIFFGAPFAATRIQKMEIMISFLNLRKGDKLADLGSGDGRIVIAAARLGIESHGYEMNPFLVLISRSKIKKQKLDKRAFIHWKSFWGVSLKDYSAITLFGIKHIMPHLERKLKKELRSGSRVASNYFKFPNWKVEKSDGPIYLYKK